MLIFIQDIFKNKAQNIEYSFGCVARSAILLKSNLANILLFNFCEQKFVQYGPIMIAIDYNGHSLLIVQEKWFNYAFGPKSRPNSELVWVRRLFNVCVLVFCAQNVCSPSENMILFLPKSRCKSIADPLIGMVNWLQLLNHLNFVWRYTKVFKQNY